MELLKKDHLKEVSCKIKGTIIKKGLLFYCEHKKNFFILQNERDGSEPSNWWNVKNKTGYKYSWVCQKSYEYLNDFQVSDFKFLKSNNAYELWTY